MTLQLPTPEELGMTPADYGDLLHGLPPWAGGWDEEPAPVVTPDTSDAIHMVHATGCTQESAEWLTTWCGLAVERSGEHDDTPAIATRALCQPCIDAAVEAQGVCPVCGQFAG